MRTLLRSSLTVPLAVCLGLYITADALILGTDTRWVGELGWTPEWANAGLYLGCCLLAGITAFLSNAYLSASFLAVIGANRVSSRLRVALSVWARNLLLGVAGHIVVIGIAVGFTLATGPTDGLEWQPFAYALLPIAIFVSLGTLVSAFVPHIIGSALAIVVAYLVCYLVASGVLAAPLLVGGYESTLVGLAYAPKAFAEYVTTATLMTAALLGGALCVVVTRRTRHAVLVVTASLVVGFVGPSALGVTLDERITLSTAPVSFHCAGQSPRVCLASGHTARLADVAARVDRVARVLESAGVDLADVQLREPLPSSSPLAGTVLNLSPSDLNADRFTTVELANAFSRPTDCSAYYARDARDSANLLRTGSALGDWVDARLERVRDATAVVRLPDSWAAAAYRGLLACAVPDSVLAAANSRRP